VVKIKEENNTQGTYKEPIIDSNLLQVRLDCSKIHERLELLLRGEKIIVEYDSEGRGSYIRKQSGKPKLNESGIQWLMGFIESIINPQMVQGNFPSDKWGVSKVYNDYIQEVQISLGHNLTINMWNWDLNPEDYSVIIDSVMCMVQPFFSRLIDNLERESYNQSLKSSESNVIKDSGFKLFG
jgi:hypothetical protein